MRWPTRSASGVGERLDQAVDALGCLQQNRPALGTCLLLVELRENGLGEHIGEQNSLCYSIRHAGASVVVETLTLAGTATGTVLRASRRPQGETAKQRQWPDHHHQSKQRRSPAGTTTETAESPAARSAGTGLHQYCRATRRTVTHGTGTRTESCANEESIDLTASDDRTTSGNLPGNLPPRRWSERHREGGRVPTGKHASLRVVAITSPISRVVSTPKSGNRSRQCRTPNGYGNELDCGA